LVLVWYGLYGFDIVDGLLAIPETSGEEEEDGVLLVTAAEEEVFPPIRSRK